MKNKIIISLILLLTNLTLNSCKNSQKNNSLQNENNNIEKPSIEKIKKDIIGSEIENWRFDKIDEILGIDILNTDITSDHLVYSVNINLMDSNTSRIYNCSGKIGYLLINKSQWKFEFLKGTIIDAEKYDDQDENANKTINIPDLENIKDSMIGKKVCGTELKDYDDIMSVEIKNKNITNNTLTINIIISLQARMCWNLPFKLVYLWINDNWVLSSIIDEDKPENYN